MTIRSGFLGMDLRCRNAALAAWRTERIPSFHAFCSLAGSEARMRSRTPTSCLPGSRGRRLGPASTGGAAGSPMMSTSTHSM